MINYNSKSFFTWRQIRLSRDVNKAKEAMYRVKNQYKLRPKRATERESKMLAKAQKWGNSLAVRIPKNVAAECGITAGSAVEVFREDNYIVIKPSCKKRFSLETLLAKITDDNLHSVVQTGEPVGKELL